MRYKPGHKQETHHRIVESASKEFRAHGFDGIGIAKLMGILDLTHGGFYAHFGDKEHLMAEATSFAIGQTQEHLLAVVESKGLQGFIDLYLSEQHRDNPDIGCLLPALSGEVARQSALTREAYTKRLSQGFDAFAERMPAASPEQRQEQAIALFSIMVGALSLARAVSDPELSKRILETARRQAMELVDAGNE